MLTTLVFVAASVTFGQCVSYSGENVGGFNCGIFGYLPAQGQEINSSGAICGYFQDCNAGDRPFFRVQGGGLVQVDFDEEIQTARAIGLSDSGLVVGYVDRPKPPSVRAFTWQNHVATILPPLAGDNWSEAHSVNTAGVVVGISSYSRQAAVRWINGVPSMLLLPIGPEAMAEDINDTGLICGWMGVDPWPTLGATPYVWHPDGTVDSLLLPPQALAHSGTAVALNDRGDACGQFFLSNAAPSPAPPILRRACAWLGGQFFDLGVLPGCDRSYALDINDAREIVGYCMHPSEGNIAFIWRNGVMTALDSYFPPPPVGLRHWIASGINDKGQITGKASSYGPDGHGVAFLLTPALPQTPGDTNCDGHANVTDLIAVITNWSPGPVGGNPADVNRDNRIDVGDLLAVVTHWQ